MFFSPALELRVSASATSYEPGHRAVPGLVYRGTDLGDGSGVEIRAERDRLHVVVPHIPHGTPFETVLAFQQTLLADLRQ